MVTRIWELERKKKKKQLNMRKSHRGAVFTGEEGTLDPGGFGPTSLGQLTGIRGECAAEGAKALHNPGSLQRASPSIKSRARYISDLFHDVHGMGLRGKTRRWLQLERRIPSLLRLIANVQS